MSRCAGVRLLWAGLAAAATAGQAVAQTAVYRCGKDGNEYSSVPCPGGRVVDVGDERSAAQRRQAQEVARREQRHADQLAAERRRREAQAAKSAPAPRPSASAPARKASGPGKSASGVRPQASPGTAEPGFTAKPPPAGEPPRPAGR